MGNTTTKGENKILLQFERFTETNAFKDAIKNARKTLLLPTDGIVPTEKDIKNLLTIFEYYIPENFPIKNKKYSQILLEVLNRQAYIISKLFLINNEYIITLIKYYILYNRFFYNELEPLKIHLEEANVCKLDDSESEIDRYEQILNDGQNKFDLLIRQSQEYPIFIRIHNDASQRDVIEYLKKHWWLIDLYKKSSIDTGLVSIKNSKSRVNKMLKERNNFIYEHKELPRKEILKLLNKKYDYVGLDQGSIGKVISIEKKKREKK